MLRVYIVNRRIPKLYINISIIPYIKMDLLVPFCKFANLSS